MHGTSTFYCTVYTAFSCTQEVQDVHSLLLLSRSIHKKIHPTYFAFLVKFRAHFACRIAYFFSLPILLKILLANFVKAYLRPMRLVHCWWSVLLTNQMTARCHVMRGFYGNQKPLTPHHSSTRFRGESLACSTQAIRVCAAMSCRMLQEAGASCEDPRPHSWPDGGPSSSASSYLDAEDVLKCFHDTGSPTTSELSPITDSYTNDNKSYSQLSNSLL